jgi:uncharacterized cupredoxin-like copper-binding protein
MATTPEHRLLVKRPLRQVVAGVLATLLVAWWPAQVSAHASGEHAASAAAVRHEQKAWGIAGDIRSAHRRVEVSMGDDMRFRPELIEVRQGETLRIVIRNAGRVMHEFVIGTKPELDAHAELMRRFPNMEHDEPYMAHVPPGRTGEIVWTFNRAGDFDFACLIAGHYQAGMVGRIRVRPATPSSSKGRP